MDGYSTNPLFEKSGMMEGVKVKLVNAPGNYPELIGEFYDKLSLKNKTTTDLDFTVNLPQTQG